MEYVDVEIVMQYGTYSDTVNLKIAELMMKANIVTIRGTSVLVKEIEVTEEGKIRFHGNKAEL
jgi:hypothetical protein